MTAGGFVMVAVVLAGAVASELRELAADRRARRAAALDADRRRREARLAGSTSREGQTMIYDAQGREVRVAALTMPEAMQMAKELVARACETHPGIGFVVLAFDGREGGCGAYASNITTAQVAVKCAEFGAAARADLGVKDPS